MGGAGDACTHAGGGSWSTGSWNKCGKKAECENVRKTKKF